MKGNIVLLCVLLVSINGYFLPAAELELYMAEPHVRIAQKIYCQLKNVTSTDKLQATLDGEVIYMRNGNLQAEEIFVAEYHRLFAGRHHLIVQVLDNANQVIAGAQKEWTTLHNGIPRVGINAENAICIDGQPFFPITSWMLNKSQFDSPIAACVNTLLSVGYYPEHNIDNWKDYLTNAETSNFFTAGPNRWEGFNPDDPRNSDTTRLVEYVRQTKDYNTLFAWYWDDEPDAGGQNKYNPAPTLYRWTCLTHQNDTNHPVWINFVGYNFTHGASVWHHDLMKEYCFLYNADKFNGNKTTVVDIFSIDYYPYEYATNGNWSEWISLEDYVLALDRCREWNYDLIPIISFIETQDVHDYYGVGHDQPCGWPKDYPWTPGITAKELNNLIWASVVHGVKGLSLFHYFCPTPEDNIQVLLTARNSIEHLAPVILSADPGLDIRDQEANNGRVDIMVKEYNDNPFIFAVNLKNQEETVTFSYADLVAGDLIQVYQENRTITADNGSFEDSFAPLAVHIYVISSGRSDFLPPLPPTGIQLGQP